MKTLLNITVTLVALASLQAAAVEPPDAQPRAERQALLEQAERVRAEAEATRREAASAAERAREAAGLQAEQARRQADLGEKEAEAMRREQELQREEMERAREELGRAHRELREATREIARAHRELSRQSFEWQVAREINLGDQAVIGVVLGKESEQGVEVLGVSPDGPAERAGLQAGDTLVSLRGESLAGEAGARARLYEIMAETQPGEALAVVVERDGETWNYEVVPERREPSSWQTMIRIPDAPEAPGAPGAPAAPAAPEIIIEHIEVPQIDHEALNQRVQELTEELKTRRFKLVVPEGLEPGPGGEFVFPESFDIEIEEFSELGEQAMREAAVWFGLPQAQGLELATVNEALGSYFKTDRGVLVLSAREDNAYRLQAGDVVLKINTTPVDTPADMLRALRDVDPGSEVWLNIKRKRKELTLTVTMPENRLGFRWSPASIPADGTTPRADR